jgi:hypothetical protein
LRVFGVIFALKFQLKVNFRIVRLNDYSGSKATIYSVILEEDEKNKTTLFEHFITENLDEHSAEIQNISSRLKAIGHKTGARDVFLKTGKEGLETVSAHSMMIPVKN